MTGKGLEPIIFAGGKPDFFGAFNKEVAERSGGVAAEPAEAEEGKPGGLPLWLWVTGLAVIVLLLLAYWVEKSGGAG